MIRTESNLEGWNGVASGHAKRIKIALSTIRRGNLFFCIWYFEILGYYNCVSMVDTDRDRLWVTSLGRTIMAATKKKAVKKTAAKKAVRKPAKKAAVKKPAAKKAAVKKTVRKVAAKKPAAKKAAVKKTAAKRKTTAKKK
jgi:hypothetical protein